jgi:hypothetical protein
MNEMRGGGLSQQQKHLAMKKKREKEREREQLSNQQSIRHYFIVHLPPTKKEFDCSFFSLYIHCNWL